MEFWSNEAQEAGLFRLGGQSQWEIVTPCAMRRMIEEVAVMTTDPLAASWKPTRAQVAAAWGKTIPDIIADDLPVLFVGINPSLYSAAVGHHFARPGNRFWPALFAGGFTPRLFSPFEDEQLIDHGVGLTNFVPYATARADELSDDDL